MLVSIDRFRDFIAACQRYFVQQIANRIRLGPIDDPRHVNATELRRVANLFLDGFGSAMGKDSNLEAQLLSLPHRDRGVAYEGAAAGKTVIDLTVSGSYSQASALIQNNNEFSFLIFLGIGEALAQLRMPPQICNTVADQPWSGQIIEGYGFFEGYFNWYDAIARQRYPAGLEPGLRAAYDQGLGRAIYFITNGNPITIRDYVSRFEPSRRAEIWSGVGLPTAYTGVNTERELKNLLDFAGAYRAELMQGVILGASVRTQQKFIPDNTEMACNIVCGASAVVSVDYSDKLSELLIDREQYSMFDWQLLCRKELRHDAC